MTRSFPMQAAPVPRPTIHNPRSPKWGDAGHSYIVLTVDVPPHGVGLTFNARPGDIEEHGRALYGAAVEGRFGPIAEPSNG